MKLRRIAATAAAAALTATAFAVPAQAQGINLVEDVIETMNCRDLDTALKTIDAYEPDHAENKTTRNELANNLNELSDDTLGDLVGGLPGTGLLVRQYTGAIADKALKCEHVAENPELPFGSSQIVDNLPMLEALSSELN